MQPQNRFGGIFLFSIVLFVLYLSYVFLFSTMASNTVLEQTATAGAIATSNRILTEVANRTPTIGPLTRVVRTQTAAAAQTTIAAPTSTPTPTFTPTRSVQDQVLDVIQAETNASSRADVAQALSLYADNAVIIDNCAPSKWVGKNQIRQRYNDVFAQFVFLNNVHDFVGIRQDSPDGVTVQINQYAKVQVRANGAIIDTAPASETWSFVRMGGDWKISQFIHCVVTYYTIMNYNSQLYLEALDKAVVQDYRSDAPNQLWFFLKIDEQYYQIVSKQSLDCIDIDGNAALADGIIHQCCNRTRDTQLWRLQSYGGYVEIIGKRRDPSGKYGELCIDIQQGKRVPMEQPFYWECYGEKEKGRNFNQLWLRQSQ